MISASETPQSAARQLAAKVLARGFKPEGLHEYRAADGTPIYWRIRAKRGDGEKWIRPMMLNGHGYELKEPAFPGGKKPLYNLDRIAADPSSPVWIVEGEKPANALTKLGAIATTSGGATSAADADWSVLAGRDCHVWPDNDDAGEKYAVSVVGILQALGCRISGVDVDSLNLPPKGDAVEWLQSRQNASLGDLQELPLIAYQASTLNAIAGDLVGGEWPEPQPLPHELPAVESFTLNLLPETLRPWIGDVSERVQCPPDFPAVAAMVALGSVLGRRVGILPKRFDSWREYPNLWGAIVGRPGVLKSPALREALDRCASLSPKLR